MEQGKKQCFQAQENTSTSWKGTSADWGTETAQLELFSKLTTVRHRKDFFSGSGIKYFAFSAQNFFFLWACRVLLCVTWGYNICIKSMNVLSWALWELNKLLIPQLNDNSPFPHPFHSFPYPKAWWQVRKWISYCLSFPPLTVVCAVKTGALQIYKGQSH